MSLFLVGDEADVGEGEAGGGGVDGCGLGGVDDGAVGHVDVMHAVHSCDARGCDACLASAADDVADMDVGKFGHVPKLLDFGAVAVLGTGGAVGIRALEDDGLATNVGHHYVADE